MAFNQHLCALHIGHALHAHGNSRVDIQTPTSSGQAGLPPFSFQALVRAEARSQEAAQAFLNAAAEAGQTWLGELELAVTLYPAVPMHMQRVANVERAQMLIESASRPALQQFLAAWQADLQHLRTSHKAVLRWAIDVDPLAI